MEGACILPDDSINYVGELAHGMYMHVHVLCMWSVFVHVRLTASAPHKHVPGTFFVQHVNNADHGPSTW